MEPVTLRLNGDLFLLIMEHGKNVKEFVNRCWAPRASLVASPFSLQEEPGKSIVASHVAFKTLSNYFKVDFK